MSICFLKKFIKEIHLRECIWNSRTRGYSSKVARQKAWKEIMEALNPDWATTTTAEERYKLKIAYMRKWKYIKDYYYRCKFRNEGGKKRHPAYFKAMSFLDAIKEYKDTPRNVESEQKPENIEQHSEDSDHLEDPLKFVFRDQYEEDSSRASTPVPTHKTSNKRVKQKQPTPIEVQGNATRNREQDEEECNSNKHFLLSLLSDMDKMDDDQNLDFRVSVLNIVKNIKNKGNRYILVSHE